MSVSCSFYEPVYYRIDSSVSDLNFPSSSNEKKGYWVGFADNQGDSLTWRILTETGSLIQFPPKMVEN